MLFEPGEPMALVGPVGGRGLGSAGLAISAPLTWKSGHFVTATHKWFALGEPHSSMRYDD